MIAQARRAIERFALAYGREPGPRARVAHAPGRVNLIGEHTDYNEGLVMPLAIDRGCACVIAPSAGDGGESRAASEDREGIVRAELAAAGADVALRGSWAAYALGPVATTCRALGVRPPPIDLAIASDVPLGAGLSSSAAVEIAVGCATGALLGRALEPLDLARAGQRAEHEFAGVPCGMMDQAAAVFGRADHALLIDCRSFELERVPLPPPSVARLIVIDSGVSHALATGEYASRRRACERAGARLGVSSLRAASMQGVRAAHLPDEERRCAEHVVGECERVLRARDALLAADLAGLGRLMGESHASLRDLYQVSCRELDALVEFACDVPGVFGARMTGGGFGGSIIVLASANAADRVRAEVSARYFDRFSRECRAFGVRAADGCRSLTLR